MLYSDQLSRFSNALGSFLPRVDKSFKYVRRNVITMKLRDRQRKDTPEPILDAVERGTHFSVNVWPVIKSLVTLRYFNKNFLWADLDVLWIFSDRPNNRATSHHP
jgi:hypothetical protein